MKKICLSVSLVIVAAIGTTAQTPTPVPNVADTTQASPTNAPLKTILSEARNQTLNYQEAFKNLLATETKSFEDYDKNGDLRENSSIESNFFVYQSGKNAQVSSELRNITKVDGKPIPDSQTRADRFLAELGKTTTAESELEKIEKEGSRYDRTLSINGLTIFEAISLNSNLLPYFDFKLENSENYQGSDVYVVSYQQIKKSPYLLINEKSSKDKSAVAEFDVNLPGALKKADVFMRGKLWIDKKTYQLWREERQLIVQTSPQLVAVETVLEYQPSEFEILVPKKVSLLTNTFKKSGENQYSTVKDSKVVFDYSKFRKFNVDVQILDDNE